MVVCGTFFGMPRKPKNEKSLVDDLYQIGRRAYLDVRALEAAERKAKAETKAARLKHRNLRIVIKALNAQPVGEDGSLSFRRTQMRVEHAEWPWRAALTRRKMTPPDYARQQLAPLLGVETAKSWLKVGAAHKRPIPEFWAKKIAEDFKDAKGRTEVPAVDESWPHGIKRG
jgi:hypothetical protein